MLRFFDLKQTQYLLLSAQVLPKLSLATVLNSAMHISVGKASFLQMKRKQLNC